MSRQILNCFTTFFLQETKTLPSLTICPWPAFRSQGFHFTNETYENMVFEWEDLVDVSVTNATNNDNQFINVTKTRSATFGICFTLKITKSLGLSEAIILVMKRSWDIIVYVHSDGEEFWLSWFPYGLLPNKFRLNIKSDNETATTVLDITEKQIEHYPKNVRPCNNTISGSSREAIWADAAYYRYFRANYLYRLRQSLSELIIKTFTMIVSAFSYSYMASVYTSKFNPILF